MSSDLKWGYKGFLLAYKNLSRFKAYMFPWYMLMIDNCIIKSAWKRCMLMFVFRLFMWFVFFAYVDI